MNLAHTALSEEAKARLQATQQAIANCRIEGMELPPDDLAYLAELIADESLTADQRLERMFAHIAGNPSDAGSLTRREAETIIAASYYYDAVTGGSGALKNKLDLRSNA